MFATVQSMKTHWIGPILLTGIGAAATLVVAGPTPPVELVTADPSVVAPVEPEAQPLEAEPALKAPIIVPEAPRAGRVVAEPPKVDTIEPWTGEDLAPKLALAALDRPHLEVDRVDPWNAQTLYPARPNIDRIIEDSDPWASAGDRAQRTAKLHVDKPKLESADPWTM
jgi:hypothetical protein